MRLSEPVRFWGGLAVICMIAVALTKFVGAW